MVVCHPRRWVNSDLPLVRHEMHWVSFFPQVPPFQQVDKDSSPELVLLAVHIQITEKNIMDIHPLKIRMLLAKHILLIYDKKQNWFFNESEVMFARDCKQGL